MDFADRLRTATHDDHRATQRDRFLDDLTRGRLSAMAHAALSAQHYFVYQVLERAAAGNAFHDTRLNRLHALERDLSFLLRPGWRDEITPSEPTLRYVARLQEVAFSDDDDFIAHHYLRYLGDLSGGQIIAKFVAKAYGLGEGLAFYDFAGIADLNAFKDDYRRKLEKVTDQERFIDEVKLGYRLNAAVLADLAARFIFTNDVVGQVKHHMNTDHAQDSLQICRALGGVPNAEIAEMSDLDADGIEFQVTIEGEATRVRIPFAFRLTERPQVRAEVTRLYHEACQTDARGIGS